jgi:N-acetylmuramoyl-L-alanine amidase
MRACLRAAVAAGTVTFFALSSGCAAVSPTAAGSESNSPRSSVTGSSVASSSPRPSTSSSSSALQEPQSSESLAGRTIVIDPGHTGAWTAKWGYHKVPNGTGGTKACNSSGTATRAGYSEHAYNLAQAKALATALRSRGATVVLTRTNDTTRSNKLCVNHRADLANSLKADLLISLHADGNLGKTHRGFHIIVSTVMHGGKTIIAKSKTLAKDLRATLQSETSMPRSNYIGKGTAYSFRSDLGTLNFSQRPAVLVEMGNMMNTTDAKLFTSAGYRAQAAVALADGITAFLS